MAAIFKVEYNAPINACAMMVDYIMATTEAEDIIDGRKCANTKIRFKRKFLHFEKWILERYPNFVFIFLLFGV